MLDPQARAMIDPIPTSGASQGSVRPALTAMSVLLAPVTTFATAVASLLAMAPISTGAPSPASPCVQATVQLGAMNDMGWPSIRGCDGPLLDGPLLNQRGADSSAAGDFNGDGRMDYATARLLGGEVFVYIRLDEPLRFQQSPALTGATASEDLTAADVTGDGRLDLVAADRVQQVVQVWEGLADGTFLANRSYAAGGQIVEVECADINGDGRTDVVGRYASNQSSIVVLLGQAGGILGSPVAVYSGGQLQGLVAADLDHDGDVDVATASYQVSAALVLWSDGTNLAAPVQVPVPPSSMASLAAADLDGVHGKELIVIDGWGGLCAVLPHQGGTSYGSATLYPLGANAQRVHVFDLEGDGDLDLATTHGDRALVTLLHNSGDGTFPLQAESLWPGIETTQTLLSIDLNDNGRSDLYVGGSSDLAAIRLPDDALAVMERHDAGAQPLRLLSADVNQDGHDDLLSFGRELNQITIRHGHGDGHFESWVTTLDAPSIGRVEVDDFTGDGINDVLWQGASLVRIWTGLPGGTLAGPVDTMIQGASGVGFVVQGDIDGDGDVDRVGVDFFNDEVVIATNDGSGLFTVSARIAVSDGPTDVAIADLDRDGDLDIVTASSMTSHALSTLTNQGNGTFGPASIRPLGAAGGGVVALRLGDLDRDGYPEAVMTRADDRLWTARNNAGMGFVELRVRGPLVHPVDDALEIVDVDGDGRMDVVAMSRNDFIAVYGQVFGGEFSRSIFASGDAVALAVGDFDHDDDQDVAVALYNDDEVSVITNRCRL